ncbi:putative immunity protein [Larkinella arboricola]
MILPKERDPRFITIRRGGTLTDSNHQLLALWAAACAERVLPLFEQASPNDSRPRQAIDLARAWAKGDITMKQAHKAAFAANAAGKGLPDAARFAALAAGQAVAVAHVAAHELGAAAYAIRAVRESVEEKEKENVGRNECQWQRDQLPDAIRDLVLDDQHIRNHLCWFVFHDPV